MAGMSGFAGCTVQPNGQSDSDGGNTSTDTPTEEASVEVTGTNFVLADSVTAPPDGQIPWARTEVENVASVPYGAVQTELRFYDSDDVLLESREGYADYIPPNTVWRDYVRYYTETPDRLDHVEGRIVDGDNVVNGREMEDISIVSSEMTAEPESGVDLAAEIDLKGATPDRVTVIGLFYDSEGRFRGTVRDVDTNPIDTVASSAGSIGIRTPPDLEDEQIGSHELVVLDGFV